MPGPVVSRGECVTLRTVEEEDLSFLQRGRTNPALRYPLGNSPDSREAMELADDADQFLATLDDAGPGTPDASEVERIGAVTVSDTSWRRPELGYWLAPEYHGEGYGMEAVGLVVEYVFRTYDHPAVGAGVYEFNDASRGLLESLGFEEEGRTRRDRFVDGAYVDTVQYSLLREDWRDRNDC